MIRRALAAKIFASLGVASLAVAALGGPVLAVDPPAFSNPSDPAACTVDSTPAWAGDITARVSDIRSTNTVAGVAAVTLRITNCATSDGNVRAVSVIAPAGYAIAGPTGSRPGTDFLGLNAGAGIAPGASLDIAMSVTLPSGLPDISTPTWKVYAESINHEGNENEPLPDNDDFAPYPASPTSIVAPTLSNVTVTDCAPGTTCDTSVGNGSVTSKIAAGGTTIAGSGTPPWAASCLTLLASVHYFTYPNSGAVVYTSTSGGVKTVTVTFPKAVVGKLWPFGALFFQVCFHYPTAFATLSGTPLLGNVADGYTGLLPTCRPKIGPFPAVVPPCVSSRTATINGIVIVYKVPAGVIDPGHMAG